MRQEKKDKRRQDILVAAFQVFAEKGYHNTKISDIAELLQMGHGTFYRYFRNKLDIFVHVIDLVIGRVAEMIMVEDPESTNSFEEYQEQVKRIAERMFDLLMMDRNFAKILFEQAPGIDSIISEKVQDAWGLFGEYTAQYLHNGVNKGFLRPDLNIKYTALVINSMIFEGGRQLLQSETPEDTKKQWMEAAISLIFSGVGHPSKTSA